MTIEKLNEMIHSALKIGATLQVEVLRSVLAAVKKASIDERCEITEELIDKMLLKEQKIIQEMIDTCPTSRQDLLEEYQAKKDIIDFFAPIILKEPAEVRFMVEQILTEAEIDLKSANKGQVMKIVMPKIKGKADMKVANQCITELLNQ